MCQRTQLYNSQRFDPIQKSRGVIKRISHVHHVDESRKLYGWVTSPMWMSRVNYMDESMVRNYTTHNDSRAFKRAEESITRCNTLQHTATHCNTLQLTTIRELLKEQRSLLIWASRPTQTAVDCPVPWLIHMWHGSAMCEFEQCAAVCFSVLQCVTVCCNVFQRVAVCYSVLQCV